MILSKCIQSPCPSPIQSYPRTFKIIAKGHRRKRPAWCPFFVCDGFASGTLGLKACDRTMRRGQLEPGSFEIVSQVFDVGCRMDRADLVEPALTASTWGCHFGKRRLLQTFWWSVAWISPRLGALVDERRNQLCKQLSNIDSYLWAVGIQKGTPELHWTSTILRSEIMPLMIAHAKLGM